MFKTNTGSSSGSSDTNSVSPVKSMCAPVINDPAGLTLTKTFTAAPASNGDYTLPIFTTDDTTTPCPIDSYAVTASFTPSGGSITKSLANRKVTIAITSSKVVTLTYTIAAGSTSKTKTVTLTVTCPLGTINDPSSLTLTAFYDLNSGIVNL
jgi:hypothetical protein